MTHTVFAPGKLVIAGEYAVLTPGYPSVVAATDWGIRVAVAEGLGRLQALHYDVPWQWGDKLPDELSFVQAAFSLASRYLDELSITKKSLDLRIESDLAGDRGKYGLGSSAAVVVGVLKSIFKVHDISISHDHLFKLAAIAHIGTQGSGSGIDVAAAVYGGLICFQSMGSEWLLARISAASNLLDSGVGNFNDSELALMPLISTDWPNLSIQRLPIPADWHWLVAWSGQSARTSEWIQKLKRGDQAHADFLRESCAAVETFTMSLGQIPPPQAIAQNRAALRQWGQANHVAFETPNMTKLIDLAIRAGGAAKQSGTGGGDCIIAIAPDDETAERIRQNWSEFRFYTLPLKYPFTLNVHQGHSDLGLT